LRETLEIGPKHLPKTLTYLPRGIYTKVRFAAVDYNTDWVVFELAPKK